MDSSVIRPELLTLSREALAVLTPYFWVLAGIVITMLLSVMKVMKPKWPVFFVSVAVCIAAAVASAALAGLPPVSLFADMMISDPFSNFFNVIFLVAMALTALVSLRYLDEEKLQYPEYYVLLLLSTFGMMLMASATNLIVIFIALEIMSLSTYVLVGFRRADRRSNEAAMKYFILGSAASAVMLYGAALLYGTTGSLQLSGILNALKTNAAVMSPAFMLGVWLTAIGFLFKVAAAPFHMWMPDVYEGAPVPITGFMTTGIKAASFAAFVRVFHALGYGHGLSEAIQSHIHDILWVCAVLTMAVGNFVALTQTNLKRMLAYSSIAHSGYLLVGLLAAPGNANGYGPVMLYLAAYSIMNLGAFAVLSILAGRGDSGLNLHDLAGLSQRRPWLAFSLAVFLFSMAGIPPTAGFAAKYLMFYSAVQAGEVSLVVISVLCSAVSVYFYLRVLVYMYMHQPVGAPPAPRWSIWAAGTVGAMTVLTLQLGILPSPIIELVRRISASFA